MTAIRKRFDVMMDEPRPDMLRRLAAILSADAVGYSRLMGDDDVATVRTLSTHRALMSETVISSGGRVVDSPGDNFLAEFASAVDAVKAASAIQIRLGAANASIAEGRRMAFRIGVNLGDVLVEDGRIYGDGVNVAARLEAQAEPGGILISSSIYDQVRDKVAFDFVDRGKLSLKNIPEPVHVYALDAGKPLPPVQAKVAGPKRRSMLPLLGAGIVAAIIVAGGAWLFFVPDHAAPIEAAHSQDISPLFDSPRKSAVTEKRASAMPSAESVVAAPAVEPKAEDSPAGPTVADKPGSVPHK
jgi:adenylate cyclase